jgi:hypothetical protein
MSKVADIISSFSDLSVAELEELDETIRAGAAEIPDERVPSLLAAADAAELTRAATADLTAAGNGESRIRRMARIVGRATPSPEALGPRNGAVLVASGNLNGIPAGEQIADRYQLGAALARTLEGMPRHGAPRGPVIVASADWGHLYPEERRLGSDQERNGRLLDQVLSPAALTASGGICSPVDVDFGVPTWSDASRPFRDGLPQFLADRGGLTYIQSPVMSTLAGATTVWTEATDASPGASTKPVLQIVCGTPTTVYADAVPSRFGVGNMMARFSPEQLAASVDLGAVAAARIAENNLLNRLAAACTADVTTAILLGATRDLLTAVNQAAANLRSVHRIASSTVLTAVFPAWVRDLIRVDLGREIGHAQSADFNSLALSDDDVADLLVAQGIKPIFHLDGQPSSVAGGVAQVFPVQTASGAINTFPTKLVWYMFPEGSVQFLDAGRLDLGIVRDATLDAVNDMEIFLETFEGLALRGFTGAATQFVSSLCANGQSAGTTATTSDCA